MKNKTSIIQKVIQQIYDASTYDAAKNILLNTVQTSKINPDDKRKMLSDIQDIENKHSSEKARLAALQVYATNSMFKKMGMSTSSRKSYY